MTEQEQIEEMAEAIYKSGVAIDGTDIAFGLYDTDTHFHRMAAKLYEAGYRKAEEERKKTARECLKILHNIGGCDATDEWSKGFDAAIDEAYKEISDKYKVTAFDEEDEE